MRFQTQFKNIHHIIPDALNAILSANEPFQKGNIPIYLPLIGNQQQTFQHLEIENDL